MSGDITGKQVRVVRKYPEELQSFFISNIVVQHEPDRFILSFFEVWPPVIIGETDDEKKRLLDSLESVEAKCVARIVLSPERMKEFLQIANDNYSKFEQMMLKNQVD